MKVTHGRFLSVLRGVDPDLAERLLKSGVPTWTPEGEELRPGVVHLVMEGIVAVSATTVQGSHVLLSFRGVGGLVGEPNEPNGARASEQVTVVARAITSIVGTVVFSESWFQMYLRNYPAMWCALAREWEERLAGAEGRLCAVATENADRRLARLILRLQAEYEDEDGQGRLMLSKAVLASYVGVARETIERTLKNWRARKIIETGYRDILVVDHEALARIAGDADLVAGQGLRTGLGNPPFTM